MKYELPTFRDYTVDMRLEEFRKVTRDPAGIEFISFESTQGRKLLKQYKSRLEVTAEDIVEIILKGSK